MKQVYIHIGPPKTGTTTIQHSLHKNRDKLIENGVYVPRTGSMPDKAHHHNLGWELIKAEKFNQSYGTWRGLLEEISKIEASKIVLSSEGFIRCTDDNIRAIKDYLQDYDIYIVFYARRQDKKIQSQWAQGAKTHERLDVIMPFPDWIEKNNYQFLFSDYYQIYQQWDRVFKGHVLIRVFEEGQLCGTLFEDFLTTIGVENPPQYPTSGDMNVSLGLKTLAVIMDYKASLVSRIDNLKLRRIIRSIKEFGTKKGWNAEKWSFISRETYDRIMCHYADNNRKLAQEYFHRDELFLEPFVEKTAIYTIDDIPTRDMLELNTFIIEKILPIETKKRGKFYRLKTLPLVRKCWNFAKPILKPGKRR